MVPDGPSHVESHAQWAEHLWTEGSDAAHDLDAKIERAIEHVEFLKLFFEVFLCHLAKYGPLFLPLVRSL